MNELYWKIVIKMSIKDDEDENKIIKVSFSLFVKKLRVLNL